MCGRARHLLDRPALAQRGEDREQPLPVRGREALAELHRVAQPLLARGERAVELERGQRLHQRLAEGAADRHHLAHRLHRGAERRLRAGELLERPARDLDHRVVERRLEGGEGLAGDVVGDLVERVADGEQRGDLGDREAGRLRGQRRAARDARVHLDHDPLAGRRVDRELDVRAAGRDADAADHREGVVAHRLVLAVGERLLRRDGDRVAGVDAHGVEVLDRADDDGVVAVVADHLELELLPAEDRLLEQHAVRPGSPRARAATPRRARRGCSRCRRPRRRG